MAAKPSIDEILAKTVEAFGAHQQRLRLYTSAKALYDRKFEPFAKAPDPAQWKVLRPGTAHALVDRAAAQLNANHPVVKMTPRNTRGAAQAVADLQERWGMAVLEAIASAAAIPPLDAAGKHTFFGAGIIKGPLFDFELWGSRPVRADSDTEADYEEALDTYEAMKAEKNPWIVEAVDPSSAAWDHTDPLNPGWFIQRFHKPISWVMENFPAFKNRHGNSTVSNIEIVDFWTAEHHAMAADGEELTFEEGMDENGEPETKTGVVDNIYGWVPYQIVYGVWGMSGPHVEDIAVPMLFAAEDELLEEARIDSVMSWNTATYGLTKIVSEDPEKTRKEMMEPSAVITADKDGKGGPKPMEMPVSPPWLDTRAAQVAQRIVGLTYSPSLGGIRQEGTTSGYMTALQVGEGRQLFLPISDGFARVASRLLRRAGWIHEHLVGETMTLWGDKPDGSQELLTLKHDSWKNHYGFKVSLEPIDPTRDDRLAMLGLNLWVQGGIDFWHFQQDYLHNENPTETLMLIMVEAAMKEPEFRQILVRVAAQEWGIQDEINKLLEEGETRGEGASNQGDFAFAGADMSALSPGEPGTPAPAGGPEEAARNAPTRGRAIRESTDVSARRAGSGFGRQDVGSRR